MTLDNAVRDIALLVVIFTVSYVLINLWLEWRLDQRRKQ